MSARAIFSFPTRREWGWAWAVALGATALTLIPYALGYALARPGWEFTGVVMNPEDSQSYFAKMLQGYTGQWLYTIPFTTEDHAPAFLGGFYLLLGQLARIAGLALTTVWHLARVSAAGLMFLATFDFCAAFLRDVRTRWIAYLLAVFGSGLGWLLFLVNQPYWLDWMPVDFKMPEAHLFFSALTFPHVALGVTLILASFRLSLGAIESRGKWIAALGAGLCNLALAIVYPFLIYLVAVILGLECLRRTVRARQILWRETFRLALAFVIPAPLVLYYAFTLSTNPVFRAWDAQAITPSPPLLHYFVAYGVMLLLALLPWRRSRSEFAFLWMWVIAVALLVYAPLNPQRRFVEGVQVPLAILAAAGWCESVWPWLAQTRAIRWLVAQPRYSVAGVERLVSVLFLMFMSVSNLYILASVSVTAAWQQPYPLFRLRDEMTAIDWLRLNSRSTDSVLGAYETGNYIAAHAGNRVVIGHWAETVDQEYKFAQVERFYAVTTDDAWRCELLQRYQVAYVWVGAQEHKLGEFDPDGANYLQRVFFNDAVRLYRVVIP